MKKTNGKIWRGGFTVVELLVVSAMLMLLAGALTTSISAASRRAKKAQAIADAQEITNAILAYEAFKEENGKTSRLSKHATEDWREFTEEEFGFLLGGESGVPVLYNASLKGGRVLDPWGRPYMIMIEKAEDKGAGGGGGLQWMMAYPNFYRTK